MFDNNLIYLLIYVDDIIITDLGLLYHYLGLCISQNINDGLITVNQTKYLSNVLEKFGMMNCKPVGTPMDYNFNHNTLKREKSESTEIETLCRQIIGSIMYAMIGSRSDLCSSISILSRYHNCASNESYIALKRVLRYVKRTLNVTLIFKQKSNDVIVGYADADWGGNVIDRKSTSGYCLFVYGCIISWCSKKQNSVALSTAEAEYISLSLSISDVCWLRNLLLEIQPALNVKATIYEDNQATIQSICGNERLKRMKHIDLKYHFIKDIIEKEIVEIKYIPTTDQLADVLTKPLSKNVFQRLCESIFNYCKIVK